MSGNRVLVIAPHMDDELIGCGGSILKMIDAKKHVAVAYVTDGSYFLNKPENRNSEIKKRRLEVDTVKKKLGFDTFFMNIPDRTLQHCEIALRSFVKVLQEYQPKEVYIPHSAESDREHRLTNELFYEACWLAEDTFDMELNSDFTKIKSVFEYEIWTPIHKPDYFEDISKYIDKKCEYINIYASQVKFVDYAQAVKGLNLYRGTMRQGSASYSEAFRVKHY